MSSVFPVLVDDTALEISGLHGWPGPYVKEFLQSFKPDGIVQLVQKVNPENMKARAIFSLGYLENREANLFLGILKHREDKIYKGFGFDPVLYPFGEGKAFGDMTMEEKGNLSHRAHALLNLCQNLVKEKGSGDS
uniref:Inosine triphosphate pyrophosphatase n=1 Tax=Panagrolaimus sp. PS1159 TaxID=55785 RepID=A0AC35GBB5_9BILA